MPDQSPNPNNVTPFPGPRRPPPKPADPRGPAFAVYGLGLLSFGLLISGRPFADLLGFACGFAAVAIAAGRREEGPAWLRSHYEFGLRTLVITGAIWTLASLATFVPLLIAPVWIAKLALGAWLVLRTLYGLVQTSRRKIIANPKTPLF
ncbi:MAG: hypothetical protein EBZ50_06140 [Alphaproteobacteria bacterium]|jgi:uncharacterized membrane protein|nr:hypothetical protein [Alphaproteobacteria bacterium]